MPDFQRHAICHAPAVEVFKILHDPARFPEWWEGTERVEGEGEEVTRYKSGWPDFAYPTAVTRSGDGAVTISCLKFDVIQEWRLEPHPDGCAVSVRVELPHRDAGRIDEQRAEIGASLARLVALAEREVAAGA